MTAKIGISHSHAHSVMNCHGVWLVNQCLQCLMQTFSDGNTTRTKRYFTPLYKTMTENGVTKKLHYLTAETGLFAIFASYNNGEGTMHYALKDHKGNSKATTCSDGFVIRQIRISAFISEVFNSSTNCFRTELFYTQDCSSCLEELRKRYPDL